MSSEAPWIFPALAGRRWVGANLDAIARIDFPATDHGNPLNDPWFCDHWVGEVATRLGADHSWGGWLEDRAHLWRGHWGKLKIRVHAGIGINTFMPSSHYADLVRSLRVARPDQRRFACRGVGIIHDRFLAASTAAGR